MTDATLTHVIWALSLGAISAASLPLGSIVGLKVRFNQQYIAAFAAFGAGALIAALSVELVAPTCFELSEQSHSHTDGPARANFVALVVGGILGGILFVSFDAVVNRQGGHVRKRATTLAHMVAHRSKELRKNLKGALDIRPFNALPDELKQSLLNALQPVSLSQNEILSTSDELTDAYIVLDGELEIEVDDRVAERAGPDTFVGSLALFVPNLPRISSVKAATDTKCFALKRQDIDHLRALSPDFDRACRDLAFDRMERLEQHLIHHLQKAVEWSRSAGGGIRLGTEVPAMEIHRAHAEHKGSPMAVWLGILLDGIPESLVIGGGLYMVLSQHPAIETLRFIHVIPYTLIAGLFLSNFPEALASSANMLAVGLNRRRIFWMWFALMVTTAIGAGLGFLLAGVLSETWLVFAQGVAAGAMLTMITAAMIPEAAAHGHPSLVGLSTLGGFLAAVLFKLLE